MYILTYNYAGLCLFTCRHSTKIINALFVFHVPRAAVVHLNFRAGSAFPVPVCTVPSSRWTRLAGATRLTRSDFMLHIGRIYFY